VGEGGEAETLLDPDHIKAQINGLRISLEYAPTEAEKKHIRSQIDGLLIALEYATI
jgi:hypothetical protein